MCPGGYPATAGQNWRSAFLPGAYQGTYIDTQFTEPEKLVENIRNDFVQPGRQRPQLDLLQEINRRHLAERPGDPQLEARIQSFELAYRMQSEALDAFDVNREAQATPAMYGDTTYGRQLLIGRRLLERGVRFVQIWQRPGQPWDAHDELEKNHRDLAGECDQPIGALLKDLKQRGLLESTLVIWGGEFGRTPTVEIPTPGVSKIGNGRDHNHYGFSMWLAGGGVKGGMTYGATDELGWNAVENRMHVHDLHATILHLLGFDHERLTYRYAGRDFRLTDVHGNVAHDIIA
jgi:arylsulfatase A-like enzyme